MIATYGLCGNLHAEVVFHTRYGCGQTLHRLEKAVATRIYILEPQWNPFIELQAMARAQRLGQTKQVIAIRYITENTIESVILLQSFSPSNTLNLMQQ